MYHRTAVTYMLVVCLVLQPVMAGDDANKKTFSESVRKVSEIQAKDQTATAVNFEKLRTSNPPPEDLTYSQERHQLDKRFRRFNTKDKIGYIYLISKGQIMAFFVVQGKVSSVDSKLTCTQQIVSDGMGDRQTDRGARQSTHVVESPAMDGSFGTNGNAIFFYTDTDAYIEHRGKYVYCDQYISLKQPPTLTIKSKHIPQ